MAVTGQECIHSCNLCEGRARVLLPGIPTIVRCEKCGLVSLAKFPSPEERTASYQEEYCRGGSRHGFPEWLNRFLQFFKKRRARDILRREPGPASLLDVGCGQGILLEQLLRRGWKVLGTQISRRAAQSARQQRGVDVFLGELLDLDYRGPPFRVVTFYHVLEHLDRPMAYLRKAHDLMEEGGLLVLEVPNFASPGFRFLGLRNLSVDYPHHLIFYTPATLRCLVETCGFEVTEVRHFSLEYSPFTTLQNLLNLLPGRPNRLYCSLLGNRGGERLGKSPWTWIHALIACALAGPAFLISLSGLFLPLGNTMRFYCRKSKSTSLEPSG